tara:strand:+ start:382 stop:570 length:189 start_codon:yes stop_codon:yes gene_type:complete
MNISNCNFTTNNSPDPKVNKTVVAALCQVIEANRQIAEMIAEAGKSPAGVEMIGLKVENCND